jgi:hypothetical protein
MDSIPPATGGEWRIQFGPDLIWMEPVWNPKYMSLTATRMDNEKAAICLSFLIQQNTGKTARSSSQTCASLCIIVHPSSSIIIHPHESANGGTFLSSGPRAKLCERSSRPFSVQRQKTCVQAIAMVNGTGTVRHDWSMCDMWWWLYIYIGSRFSIVLAYWLWRHFSHSTHITCHQRTSCWHILGKVLQLWQFADWCLLVCEAALPKSAPQNGKHARLP